MVSFTAPYMASALVFFPFTSAFPQLLRRASATVSPDGSCGGSKGYTCQGSNYGTSCGKNNKCGSDFGYSKISNGCQPAYGFCYTPGSISPDGSCGGTDQFICLGSNYGNSCGQNNQCGRDTGYSGAGNCQPQYGYCQTCTTTVAPSTTTLISKTTRTTTVTISTSITATVKSGISSVSTTTTSTTTVTVTSAGTTTANIITTPTTTVTAATTLTTTIFSGTEIRTIFVPSKKKRGVTPRTLAAAPFLAPRASPTGAGLSCGTIVSTGFTTTSTTSTTTLTASSTTTTTSTVLTTVPSATTTSTATVVSTTTSTSGSVSTVTVTVTAPPTVSTTTSSIFSTFLLPQTVIIVTMTDSGDN